MKKISRAAAKARGLKFFFTGVPCKHGHISKRYVSTPVCFACNHRPTELKRRKRYAAAYWKSAHGRAVLRRYQQSPKGRAIMRRAVDAYRRSKHGQEKIRLYKQSPEGKAAERRYHQSPKGKATMQRWLQSPFGKEAMRSAIRRYRKSPLGKEATHRRNLSVLQKEAQHRYRLSPKGQEMSQMQGRKQALSPKDQERRRRYWLSEEGKKYKRDQYHYNLAYRQHKDERARELRAERNLEKARERNRAEFQPPKPPMFHVKRQRYVAPLTAWEKLEKDTSKLTTRRRHKLTSKSHR